MDAIKAAPIVSKPHPTSVLPPGESTSGSPKKKKTLMSDDVSQADLTITTLMQDSGSSNYSKSSSEFKLWSNSFDRLGYLYDHLTMLL